MYLMQRGQVFWFSRHLKHLASHFIDLASGSHVVGNNGYLRFSLNTGNRREAERLARRFAVEVDDALVQIERAKKISAQPITSEDIQIGAATMLTDLLASDESLHKVAIDAALSGHDVERSPDRERGLAENLPPPGVAGDAELLRNLRQMIPFYLLQSTGKPLCGTVDSRYLPFAAAFRQAVESLSQRAEGKPIPTPPMPKVSSASYSSWNGLMDYYLEHHKDLADSTKALYVKAMHDLAEYAKCPPAEITRSQVVEWRDQLLKQVKPKTALTRLNGVRTVYSYGLDNEKLGERRNPFSKVSVAGAKKAKSSRQEYSLDDLKEVFRDPPLLADIPASAGKHAALWVPMISLFTGARREEIAGLLMEDVVELVPGKLLYIHIKDNAIRKIKGDSSGRRTPIHAELLRLGFKEYVDVVRAAGAERLFPCLVNSDGLADWFIPRVKSRLGDTGYKKDIHSFRHTIKTVARDIPLPDEIHNAITGHKTPGVGANYGSVAGIKTLKRELDKITYAGLVLTPPPIPTVADINAQIASAKRRAIVGESRRKKPTGETN